MYLKPTLHQNARCLSLVAAKLLAKEYRYQNMDFLDPKKKRAHHIRLFVGYFLVGLALFIGTMVLFFEASGFDVDRKTGAIIQNGLVFIDAHPAAATVYINGTDKGQTDTRLVLPAGPYDVELKRPGYRTWKRTFNLMGSTIERLVYAFLFPEKLDSKDLQVFQAPPGLVTTSPDRHWLLIQQPGTVTNFNVIDLSTDTNAITALAVPNAVLTPGPGTNSLELVEWSTDNRHVLIKHTFQGGSAFIIIDREDPSQSLNLNQTFPNISLDSVKLRDKKFDQYYVLSIQDGSLTSLDIRSRVPTVIASRVFAFQPHGADVLMYVTDEGAPAGKAFVRIREGTTTYTLREIAASPSYLIDLARFENNWYMAVGSVSDPRIHIYKDAFDTLKKGGNVTVVPYTVLRIDNPQYLAFSANTRFIGVQSGSRFAVYDAEEERHYTYDTKLALLPNQKAAWMDGHRYAVVSAGKLVVFDYDGINLQTLIDTNPNYIPFFDRDYNALFTISTSMTDSTKQAVVRTELRTQADR
jgi:hypothetical protein